MSFEKYFDRPYEMIDFPHFVPGKELDYNVEYASRMHEEGWIAQSWRRNYVEKGKEYYTLDAARIIEHGGLILEICAGPGGGYMPAVLAQKYDASIMISDLCPTVVREWQKFLGTMNDPPPNIEYAAFNVCDMPFRDDSIDVISGSGAIGNIEGDRNKGLEEIFRVLKPGGLFIMSDCYITQEFYEKMEPCMQEIFNKRWPTIFWHALDKIDELGFSSIETQIGGSWSNKNDESILAEFCRELGVELIFSGVTKYCIKKHKGSDLSDDELIDKAAKKILDKYKSAFEELAKS